MTEAGSGSLHRNIRWVLVWMTLRSELPTERTSNSGRLMGQPRSNGECTTMAMAHSAWSLCVRLANASM